MKKLKLVLCFNLVLSLFIGIVSAETDFPIEPTPGITEETEGLQPEPPEATPESSVEHVETIQPTETPSDIPSITVQKDNNDLLPSEEFKLGDALWKIEDTGLTAKSASEMIKNQLLNGKARAAVPLQRVKRLAAYQGPGGEEYVSLFMLNGLPAWCIEPYVLVILDGAGNGPVYDSIEPADLTKEQIDLLGRIMFYGYGHPLSGNSDAFALATQLLIWQIVAPAEYGQIMATLKWCTPTDQACAVTGGSVDVSAEMNAIMNLVENRDTVPSFADDWHGTNQYNLNWNETLRLNDANGVLDWFNDWSEESHTGINIRRNGNDLLVDIDSLYYEGHDTLNGKTLTFSRKDAEFQKYLNGVLLWISGANQKLMAGSAWDPTPKFTLSFKMNTADIDLRKLDEYYQFNNSSAGTQFIVGWMEDPETQYLAEGDRDNNWTHIHDWNKPKIDDKTGQFNFQYGEKKYYPLMTEDGSSMRKFTIGADGILHIDGLLPSNKKWWIKEVNSSNPYLVDMRVFSSTTGNPGTTTTMDFVNNLRDVTLEVVKQDGEDEFKKINGATYTVYEVAGKNGNLDLDKAPTLDGIEGELNRVPRPTLTYKQLVDNTAKLALGESFFFNGFIYTIVNESETGFNVDARKAEAHNYSQTLSRTQLPANLKVGDSFEVDETIKPHGTSTSDDDTIITRKFEVVEVDELQVVLKEADLNTNISLTADTIPSIDDLPLNLKIGEHFILNGVGYTVKEIQANKVIVNPDALITIHLNDFTPNYFEIPNVRELQFNGEFSLGEGQFETKYTVLNLNDPGKEISFSAEGTTFKKIDIANLPGGTLVGDVINVDGDDWTVEQIKPDEILLSTISTQTVTIQVPQWIAYEDVPGTIEDTANLTVKDIKNPVYTVKAIDSGIQYVISDHEINQIKADGTFSRITDGTIPGYLDIIQSNTSDNGGACEEPYNTNGCPVGTIRTYTYIKNESYPYTGLQYDELEAFLGHPVADLVEDNTIEHNGVVYTVKVPVDVAEPLPSITLSWNDGKEHTITLVQGTAVTEYIDVITITKDYEIVKATDKEILLTWTDAVLGKNTMSNQRDFMIRSYTDTATKLDLSYDKIPGVANLTINQTFVVSDQTYKVLFNDGINQYLIVEDTELNWYEVTPSGTNYYSPMTYGQYIGQETENGIAYKKGDTLQSTFTRRIVLNDDFSIDGYTYTLTENARADIRYKVMFGWDKNSPFSWSEILGRKNAADEFIEDGNTYKLTSGHRTVCNYQLENLDTGEKWPYCDYTLLNDDNEIPYEDVEPLYHLEVFKPGEITYADFLDAYPLFDAEEGDTFIVGTNTYEIIILDTGKVTVKNTKTKKSFVLLENEDHSTYETTELWFIEKGSIVDLDTIFNLPADREVIYSIDGKTAKAELVDNMLTANDVSRFTAVMTDTASGIILDQKEVIITKSNNGKGQVTKLDGLPMFVGETGKQYIRLVDTTNHNMALPFYSITLYSDQEMKTKVATYKSNGLGTIDVSALAEGKYYYANPITAATEEVVIINSKQMEGQLSVDKLKWGRTYVACELKLPDGYDYQDEVCHTFTMDVETGKNVANSVLLNKLRRLGLQVVKVDHNNRETLLNGAWFTVRDITKSNTIIDENEQSTLKSKLLLSDVPGGAVVGETFLIWRAKENGKRTQYTIKSIRDEEIVIEDIEGNQYWIPVIGTNEKAPLLYSDIKKLLPTMEVEDIFTAIEKEPKENMKMYQITALTEEDSTDIFGNPVKTITSATVIDTNDNNKMPIVLNAIQNTEKYPADQLGKYVSGAIFVERTQQVRNELITWPEILNQVSLANLEVGKKVTVQKRILSNIPAFTEVKGLNVGDNYIKDGTTWNIVNIDDFKATVALNGTSIIVDTSTVLGAVEALKNVEFEVVSVTLDGDGNKVAVTIKDTESGSTLYVHKDAVETFSTSGLPGVNVKVSDREDMGLTLANGYTNARGQVLFDTLVDGTYYVQVGNEAIVEMKVAKGTIFLPEVKYGSKVEVCETKSPLGYLIGDACEVIVPVAEYTQDTVKNFRTNKKIVWWEEGGRRLRKMGVN